MILDIAVAIAFAAVLVKALDFFLSDKQKKTLDLATTRFWNRLDDEKRASTAVWSTAIRKTWLFEAAASVVFYAGVVIFLVVFEYRQNPKSFGPLPWPALLITLSNVGIFLPIILIILSVARTRWNYFLHALLIALILGALWPLQYFLTPAIVSQERASFVIPILMRTNETLLAIVILLLVSCCVRVATLFFLAAIFCAVEFTVRRVCEYPKGVVLGIGTLVGIGAAVVKIYLAGSVS